MRVRQLLQPLTPRLRSAGRDRELREEIAAHLELATEENIRRGMSEQEAREAARRAFGSVDATRERHRDQRGGRWLEQLLRDLQFGARSRLW